MRPQPHDLSRDRRPQGVRSAADQAPAQEARIDFVLLDPRVQGLRHAANLAGDRFDGRPLRRMLATVLQHHAHGTLTHLRGKLRGLLHGPFSRVGASSKPGAIHVYFNFKGREVGLQTRPKRTFKGQLISSRIRRSAVTPSSKAAGQTGLLGAARWVPGRCHTMSTSRPSAPLLAQGAVRASAPL